MMLSFEKMLLSGRLFDLSLGPVSSMLRFKAKRIDDMVKVSVTQP